MPAHGTSAYSNAKRHRRHAFARLACLQESDLGPHDLRINAHGGDYVQVHRVVAASQCPIFRSDDGRVS